MKIAQRFLTLFIYLAFLWCAYLAYFLVASSENIIEYGLQLIYALLFVTAALCLQINFRIEGKTHPIIWGIGFTVLLLTTFQYIKPELILYLWNYTLALFLVLIGHTLLKTIGGHKLVKVLLLVSFYLVALILLFKLSFNAMFVLAFFLLFGAMISSLFMLLARKNQ